MYKVYTLSKSEVALVVLLAFVMVALYSWWGAHVMEEKRAEVQRGAIVADLH